MGLALAPEPSRVPAREAAVFLVGRDAGRASALIAIHARVCIARRSKFARKNAGKRIPGGRIDRLIERQANAVADQIGLDMADVSVDHATSHELPAGPENEMDFQVGVRQQADAALDQRPNLRDVNEIEFVART